MFQLVYSYFKKIANSDHILTCKSKKIADESIIPASVYENSLTSALKH